MGAPHPHPRGIPGWFLLSVFKLLPAVQRNPAEGLGTDTVMKMKGPIVFRLKHLSW